MLQQAWACTEWQEIIFFLLLGNIEKSTTGILAAQTKIFPLGRFWSVVRLYSIMLDSTYVCTCSRTDISSTLRKNLQVETMVVVGSKASNLRSVHTMHQSMDSSRAQLLQLDGVGDVLSECVSWFTYSSYGLGKLIIIDAPCVFPQQPEKMAQSLLLFVKGLGLLTSVTMVGVQRQRTFSGGSEDEVGGRPRTQRSLSMEEYDRPNLQRLLSRERRESRDETVQE